MKTSGLSLDQAPPEDIPFRFFLSTPIFGIIAGIIIAIKGNQLFSTNWHPETIALTHLFTLGWLAMTMMGAFYQMVPVLAGGQVPYITLSRIVHLVFTFGILSLVFGFFFNFQLLFLLAVIFLIISFTIFITQISIAVFKQKADRPVLIAMRISISSLAITALLGILSVGALAGWWMFPLDRVAMKGIHLTFGFLGWIGSLIIGVGFHLIPMFYLSPPFPIKHANWILRGIMLCLFLVPIYFLVDIGRYWLLIAGSPGMVAVAVFVVKTSSMLKQRKRKIVDTTQRFWKIGLITFPLSLIFTIVYLWWPEEKFLFLFGMFFLIGFALSITSGVLYKILPFLVWFHRYSSLAGQAGVPLLKDILPARLADRQWKAYMIMFLLLIVGIVFHIDISVRLAGGILVISSGLLFTNFYKAIYQTQITKL